MNKSIIELLIFYIANLKIQKKCVKSKYSNDFFFQSKMQIEREDEDDFSISYFPQKKKKKGIIE